MSPFALSRLAPIGRAAAIAGTALAVLDLLLRVSFGAHPDGMAPPFDPAAMTRFYGRVGAFEIMRADQQATDAQLVAVVGMSTVKADLDPAIIVQSDPQRRKWMVLGAEGRNLTQVAIYCRPVLASQLRPRLVVLGIHPFMLRTNERETPLEQFNPITHLRHFQRRPLVDDFLWLGRNQFTLGDTANLLIERATERVRCASAVPIHEWYPIDSRPWDSWNRYVGARAPDEVWEREREVYQTELIPEQFNPQNGQPQALREVAARIRARGSEVVCVLMPESSQLRSLYPSVLASQFADAIASASPPGDPLRVVDLRAAFSDDLFFDCTHLNADGRLQISKLFAKNFGDR